MRHFEALVYLWMALDFKEEVEFSFFRRRQLCAGIGRGAFYAL